MIRWVDLCCNGVLKVFWEIMVADLDFSQYNFRMNALAGNIPGVKKAAW